MIGMQLPQHIIDLVGNLFDEGMDDETICHAVLKEWELHKESPRRNAFGNDDLARFLRAIRLFPPQTL